MMATKQSWARLLGRMLLHGVILGVCVFVAVHAAMAREGERGGHTRTFLTVAGSITVRSGVTPHLTFIFEKVDPLSDAGAAPTPTAVCTVTNASTQYNASTGSFSSEIPIDACPGSMFDGANVWVTTVVRDGTMTGAELLRTERRPLNPVPYARYADQVGVENDCPVGYENDPTESRFTLCKKALGGSSEFDEVVKVGRGATSFWIDRYEATICSTREGPCGVPINTSVETDLSTRGLPRNGQWTGRTPVLFARSTPYSSPPSRWVTWFQAQELCRASGKRLPTGPEWLTSARGTPQVGSECLNDRPGTGARNTNTRSNCTSGWGAQDMVGNLQEFTEEWFAGLGVPASSIAMNPWPGDYGSSSTYNITSGARSMDSSRTVGLPAVALRGGEWNQGGIFELNLAESPARGGLTAGFRCVIPR